MSKGTCEITSPSIVIFEAKSSTVPVLIFGLIEFLSLTFKVPSADMHCSFLSEEIILSSSTTTCKKP